MGRALKKVVTSSRARSMILFSILNAVAQLALQGMLIQETNKAYQNLQGFCLSQSAFSRSMSATKRENFVLGLLHIFALVMHIVALMSSSSVFNLFLLVLFTLSTGSGFTQLYIFRCEESCDCSKQTTLVKLGIARLTLAMIFLAIFIGFAAFLSTSVFNPRETYHKASIPTLLFFVTGIAVLAVEGRPTTLSSPFFCLWIAFALLALFIAVVLTISRHYLLKDEVPVARTIKNPKTSSLSSTINIPLSSQTITSDDVSLTRRDPVRFHEVPIARLSTSEPRYRAMDPFSELSVSESILVETTRSTRTSVGTDTFLSIETMDPTPIPEIDWPLQRPQESVHTTSSTYTTSPAEISDLQSSPPCDNRLVPLPPSEGEDLHGTSSAPRHLTSSHQPLENPFCEDDEPVAVSASSPSLCSYPTTPSRSPSVSNSTPTVPPYTYGSYNHLPRRDTLTSNGTYETLPSYHSRQSSSTLPDFLDARPTRRGVRSLPPLPPFPPAASDLVSALPSPNPSTLMRRDDEHVMGNSNN
ncbi:hypothetical protein L218DRAFT_381537 [Marasmius fiardii PR-910]|nr:hypothetical protein L218DRAFT_381537 [Marasmius fiardii PR-910]